MLYCIRMDVRVPHALAPEQLERLEAEEKARAQELQRAGSNSGSTCQNGARGSGAVRCRGDSATGAGDGQLPPASSGAGAGLRT